MKPPLNQKQLSVSASIHSAILLIAVVVLVSCGPTRRAEMSKMDDQSLTEAMKTVDTDLVCLAVTNKWGDDRYQKFALMEAVRRGLGDCSSEHKKCVSFGFKYLTKEYKTCRMEIEKTQIKARSAAPTKSGLDRLGEWGKELQKKHTPKRQLPKTTNCSSRWVGSQWVTQCY
jgi:hypothetical protein